LGAGKVAALLATGGVFGTGLAGLGPGAAGLVRIALVALVVDRSDGTACTMYPPDVDEPYRTTTWITAMGDSFVDVEKYR
jgi:hypothetical protein